MKKGMMTFIGAFVSIFDLTGGNFKIPKRPVSEIERGPHLVYQDFELVGTDMRQAIDQLKNEQNKTRQ
jgi:hypothetical protein